MRKMGKDKSRSLEQTLWESADKLRKNMDAAEYKKIVMGLIFLKYISYAHEDLRMKLSSGKGSYKNGDPEDIEEYRAENVFFVPPEARWSYLMDRKDTFGVGHAVDHALVLIEQINPSLKGILSREYIRPDLPPASLGQLLTLIDNVASHETGDKNRDLLGCVYEYCLGQFAAAEGKKGGQFYTPSCVVKLLVEMLEPYSGRVFDPCCGSGGMFIQSERFVEAHQGRVNDITIYGQESNLTTYRLCRMNLAIRGLDASNIKFNNEGSLLNDAHPGLQADYIMANPPFNDSDWSGELLRQDHRWAGYETPPPGNANFAWLLHIVYHLSPRGVAGVVLSNGSLSSPTTQEGRIRKRLALNGLVDCIVGMPDKLFYNTGIPACLWFLNRGKSMAWIHSNKSRRFDEILFIDARTLGLMINRKTRILTDQDIALMAGVYHRWRQNSDEAGGYADVPGLWRSVSLHEVAANDYILSPARYVGMAPEYIPNNDETVFIKEMEQLYSAFTILSHRGAEMDAIIDREFRKLLSLDQ